MHDIVSRHLWEQLLSILLSLVHFYFELLKISEIFQRKKNVEEICHGIVTADVLVKGLSRGAIATRLA